MARVGVFVPALGVKRGYEHSISAHMQIPLQSAHVLQDQGHVPILLASIREGDDVVMPALLEGLPSPVAIPDARKRGQLGEHHVSKGYLPVDSVRHIAALRRAVIDHGIDVLNLVGSERMVRMAGMLRLLRFPCRIVVTVIGPPADPKWSPLYRRVDSLICTTGFTATQWTALGCKPSTLRHGVCRDLGHEVPADRAAQIRENFDTPSQSIVYWRIATEATGGDLVLQAFDEVAVEFPDTQFTMLLRSAPNETPGLAELEARRPNCHIHRFPYEDPFLLQEVLSKSTCAVFPYRSNTVDPQMSILETLDFGVPCIVSTHRSNPELVAPGVTGLVVETTNHHGVADALRTVLNNDVGLLRGPACTKRVKDSWDWQTFGEELGTIVGQLAR